MSKEVLDVCNLSTGVFNRGLQRGEMKKAKETAYRLQRKGMSWKDISEMIDVSVSTVQEWLSKPQTTPAEELGQT